ncbi:MAG TPA: hypothetical protein VF765_10915 [Polyangiaceae bacterium]
MDTVTTRLHETGQHFAKQGDAFVTRTRDAGAAFFGETRDAGRHLLGAIETEAKRWRRYASMRGTQLRTDARTTLSIASAEKALLTQVDRTLRAIDARIRARLAQLERKPAGSKTRKGASNGKGGSSSKTGRKSKQALPPLAA